jgi:hypothetical protein
MNELQLRLGRRVLSLASTNTSPRSVEGKSMVKARGKVRVNSEPIRGDRILRHPSVKMELLHFVKT